MRFTPLDQSHADIPHHDSERSEEAAIIAEIARHFLELREKKSESRSAAFLNRLHSIHQVEPAALWVVLRLLTGDLDEITRSYSDMGKENARSKQAIQQEMERVIIAIDRHWPRLSAAIIQLRSITAQTTPQRNVA